MVDTEAGEEDNQEQVEVEVATSILTLWTRKQFALCAEKKDTSVRLARNAPEELHQKHHQLLRLLNQVTERRLLPEQLKTPPLLQNHPLQYRQRRETSKEPAD
jgi:hypothetical protein